MLKRKNPFGDSSPLQFKSHIGVKELNKESEQKMQDVHERTRQLLFQGSLKVMREQKCLSASTPHLNIQKPVDSNMNMVCDTPMDIASSLPTGQLQIDSTGHLCRGLKVTQPNETKSSNQCSSCRTSGLSNMQYCRWCDKANCNLCLRQCNSCGGLFCFLCSLLNYDDHMERAFCLQCTG